MRISSKTNLVFQRPNIDPGHPFWDEVRHYPGGFQILPGETKDAPDWIRQSPLWEWAKRDGDLTILEAPADPRTEWRIPVNCNPSPNVWRDLRSQFEALHELEVSASNHLRLIAFSRYDTAEYLGTWNFSGGNARVQARYEEIGTEAGLVLGAPEDKNPLEFWLHHTWVYLRSTRSKEIYVFSTDFGGCINQIIDASAAHCSKLAMETLKMQRHASHRIGAVSDEGQDQRQVKVAANATAETQLAPSQPSQSNPQSGGDRNFDLDTSCHQGTETPDQRSDRRRSVVDPLMQKARISSDDKWADKAGLDRNTARDYRNGKTGKMRFDNRQALAKAIGITETQLPD